MPLYTPGSPVRAVVDGVEEALTPELVSADVTEAAGGRAALSGIPVGGSTSALLRKVSGADGDVAWIVGSGRPTLGAASDTSGTTPRPEGYETVLWTAPSRPSTALAGDIWIKP